MYGWMGTILRVNLTNGEITREPLEEELAHKYVGGRGLNIKLLYDEIKPGIDPLGPENKIIFAAGPACGTLVPGNQRWTLSAKSPLSGFIGDANCGSSFGVGLKYAGYDALIVEGKSDRPLYLWIDDDNVHLRDATHIWGKRTTDTEKAIEKGVGDPDVDIACIGPAGENLVRFASVISDTRAAARTGVGAVLGSKKLKAVAVRGSKGVKVTNHEMIEEASREIYQDWRESLGGLKVLRDIGAGRFLPAYQDRGILPTRNYREGVFEGYESIHPDLLKEYYLRPKSCFSCPVACDHVFIVPKGQYAGTFGGDLFAPIYHYTSKIGVADWELTLKLAALNDQYGVDVMDMSSIIGWLMECYELGIITADDLGGLEIEWGDPKAILEVLEMTVYRKGIGDILAEGIKKASEIMGKGSGKYAMDVKGMSIDSRDPRGSKGWALGYAVSSRGAEHCRSAVPDYATESRPEPPWLREEIKGFKGFDRFSEVGKGAVHKWYEDVRAFQHSLEICYFASDPSRVALSRLLAKLYNGVTGLGIGANEVNTIGERITNLERAFNIREGLSRKDDTLPDRFLKEPMPSGPSKGQVVNLDLMLDEYYEVRGWDKVSGFPTREKLEQLGLKEVADELDSLGKLAHTT